MNQSERRRLEALHEHNKRIILSRKLMSVIVVAILINTACGLINNCLGYDNIVFLSIQVLTSFIAAMVQAPVIILHCEINQGCSKTNAVFTVTALAGITGWSYLFVLTLKDLIALT